MNASRWIRTSAVRLLALGAVAVIGTAAPAPADAQEDESSITRAEVTRLDVPAHQMQAFREAVTKLVAAAEAAEMGEEFTWWFHQGNGYYTVVSPVQSMARFDDPEAFMRKMKDTPGEPLMEEFVAAMEKLDVRSNSQILTTVDEWAFMPEAGLSREDASLIHVLSFRVRPGMEESLRENLAGWKKAMARVEFPYRMEGYRTLLGQGGMGYLVFHADNRSNVYGRHDLRRMMEAKGMTEEYDRLTAELLDCLYEYQWQDEDFLPALSYMPTG